MKFTFKTEKPTGRYKSFFTPSHYIKYKKNIVGSIDFNTPHRIRLMVIKNDINEDGNPNCEWKWISLKKESETLEEAKEFLNENIKSIFTKHKIRQNETNEKI